MNDDSQIWAGKLKDYNEVDRSKPLTMLALSKIIKLIYVEIAKYKDTEEVEGVTQKAFEAYWKALAELFPKMFNSENSQTYNIQKSGPATIMTKILRLIMIQKYHIKSEHAKDLSLVEAKSYKKILKFLRDYKIEKKSGMELFINGGHMGQYSNEGAMNAESKKIMESIWDNGFVKNKYENK